MLNQFGTRLALFVAIDRLGGTLELSEDDLTRMEDARLIEKTLDARKGRCRYRLALEKGPSHG